MKEIRGGNKKQPWLSQAGNRMFSVWLLAGWKGAWHSILTVRLCVWWQYKVRSTGTRLVIGLSEFTVFASAWSSRAASSRAQMFGCFWLRGDDYQQLTAETFLSRRFQEHGQEAEQSEPTVAPTHRLLNSFLGLLGIPKSRQQGLEAKSKKTNKQTNTPKPRSQRVLRARVHYLARLIRIGWLPFSSLLI